MWINFHNFGKRALSKGLILQPSTGDGDIAIYEWKILKRAIKIVNSQSIYHATPDTTRHEA
jgi:hypothetical protein